MRFIFQAVIFMCLAVASAMATTYVAVVETVSSQGVLSHDEKAFVTDRLRERAKKSLPAYLGYDIMTRENIRAMLPPGKSIEDCEGSCLVETGRNINANYIAQARVGKFGESFTITVEFYETKSNRLVDSFTARESKIDGLLDAVDSKADSLFTRILQPVSVISSSSYSVSSSPTARPSPSIKHAESREKFPSVKIGNQVWMKKNLNVNTQNSWCYDNKPENCEKYGRLYTWDAAVKACPAGWHLPSSKEWSLLFRNIGGSSLAGKMLKSSHEWKNGGNGEDSYGIAILPAGNRSSDGYFRSIGSYARFWSSTKDRGNNAYSKNFFFNSMEVREYSNFKTNAFSVRCVKD